MFTTINTNRIQFGILACCFAILFHKLRYKKDQKRINQIYNFNRKEKKTGNYDLKIIVAGFPRSGTTSLSLALKQLGYTTFHCLTNEISDSRKHLRWWCAQRNKLQNKEYVNFDDFFERNNIEVVADIPLSLYWKQIYEFYPNAKVIVCIRDFDAWFESIKFLFLTIRNDSYIVYLLTCVSSTCSVFHSYWSTMFMDKFGGENALKNNDKVTFKSKLDENIKDIKNHMKERNQLKNLLIFNPIKEGWKPLCEFLNIDTPKNKPFPHGNSKMSGSMLLKATKTLRFTFVRNVIPALLFGIGSAAVFNYILQKI